ncbi:MAG: hypothetical protein ACJ789_14140 [Thermomicrobiales bacterium]
MARYLVVHTPIDADDETLRQPTNMLELAKQHGNDHSSPRWLKTWSPDLHDDRIFTLWDALNADDISRVLTRFGFLDHMSVQALRVEEWGPEEVLETQNP